MHKTSIFALALAATFGGCGGGGGVGRSSAVDATAASSTRTRDTPIAFLGDSITAGTVLPGGGGLANVRLQSPTAYPFLIAKATGVHVVDLAIGGVSVATGAASELPEVPAGAKCAVVNLGTNDVYLGQSFVGPAETAMTLLLAALRTRVQKVVLVNLRNRPPAGPDIAMAVTNWDAWLAGESQFVYDEHDAAWASDAADFMPDDEHPDPAGNALLAISVQATLSRAGCL